MPAPEPELEPAAAEVDSGLDDEESPDRSEWMEADVAEPEDRTRTPNQFGMTTTN